MAEQFLNGANVVAILEQMGGEGMASETWPIFVGYERTATSRSSRFPSRSFSTSRS